MPWDGKSTHYLNRNRIEPKEDQMTDREQAIKEVAEARQLLERAEAKLKDEEVKGESNEQSNTDTGSN